MHRVVIALAVLATVAFGATVKNPFVHDDIVFILHNSEVHDFKSITQVFNKNSFAPAGLTVANSYYRPFLDIFYRIEYVLFGPTVLGYHIVNILIHLSNAVLVFLFTRHLTRRENLSACIAAFFLVHPVQTEAVACISGISNLLFTFFLLLSILEYLRVMDRGESPGQEAVNYSTALLLFLSALFCKEQAIVLPFLLLLFEFCFPYLTGRSNSGWRLRLAGFVIVAGGYLLWRKVVLGGFATSIIENWGEFILRLKSWPAVIMGHLQTVFWPVNLHYYRSHDILSPWLFPTIAFICVLLSCVLIWKMLPQNRRVLFAFGLGWFLITVLPTTSLIPLVHEYSTIAAFEHFLYLPLVGLGWSFFIAGEYFLERIFHQRSYMIKKVIAVLVLSSAVTLTFFQTQVWSGEVPLFERAVFYQPQIGRVRLLLAKAYFDAKRYDDSAKQYSAAQSIMAGYLAKIKDKRLVPFYDGFLRQAKSGLAACHNNRGVLAIENGQYEKAVLHFKKALEADPGFAPALHNLEGVSIHHP